MQTTRRDQGRYALAALGSPPVPPPPPPPMRLVKSTNEVRHSAVHAVQAADPAWLEDAVLRILRKHSFAPSAAESGEIELDFLEPQRPSRVGRLLRAALVVALFAGAAAVFVHWRYPVQTRAVVSSVRALLARLPPPRSWTTANPVAPIPAPPSAPPVAATPVTPPTLLAPTAPPVVTTPAPMTVTTPALTTLPPSAPDQTTPTLTAHAAPPVSSAAPPASVRPPGETSGLPAGPAKAETKPVLHAVRPTTRAATVASPSADATPEAPSSPIPGSLGEAIRRAGGTGTTSPSARAPAPEPNASPDPAAGLPERPSGSLVKSALLAALPEARACMSEGDETKAIVVFESSGAVSSVQVSGASAACIQKAFGRARVPPFSQPTYRAGVPVRSN